MIRARFSPDGRYVIAGSEDGRVYVWETSSNLRVAAALSIVSYPQPLCDVSWHPTQHVLALTCFGGESPTLIYYAERSGGHVLTSADSAAAGGGAAPRAEGPRVGSTWGARDMGASTTFKARARRPAHAIIHAAALLYYANGTG